MEGRRRTKNGDGKRGHQEVRKLREISSKKAKGRRVEEEKDVIVVKKDPEWKKGVLQIGGTEWNRRASERSLLFFYRERHCLSDFLMKI